MLDALATALSFTCTKCGGSGQFRTYGRCYECNGKGGFRSRLEARAKASERANARQAPRQNCATAPARRKASSSTPRCADTGTWPGQKTAPDARPRTPSPLGLNQWRSNGSTHFASRAKYALATVLGPMADNGSPYLG